MNIFKKISAPIAGPIVSTFKFSKDRLETTKRGVSGMVGSMSDRRSRQSDELMIAEAKQNREYFLLLWGINDNPEEINRVKRGLNAEAITYSVIAMIPLSGFVIELVSSSALSLIFLAASLTASTLCLYIAATKSWRYECVDSGRLILFKDWLFGEKPGKGVSK